MNNYLINLFTIVLFPALAFASESEHHHAPGLETLLWPGINFLIYAIGMRTLYKNVGIPALRGKAASVKEQIDRAEGALAVAKQDLLELQKREIEAEKKELEDRIVEESRLNAASIIEDAQAVVRKIDHDVELRITRDFGKAEDDFRVEVVKKATALVRKEFSTSLSENQDRELRKDALRSVLN